MKRKDMYTLQELYNELEIPLSALGRKGNMSEGTVSRIRDGYPARRSTINKLLRAFSEVYGLDFNLENVSGIQIEDKREVRPIENVPSPSVSIIPIDAKSQSVKPQISIVEPKRAYARKKDTGLPDGCISATEFGLAHGIARETMRDHMNRGKGPGLIHGPGVPEDGSVLVRDYVRYEERPKRVRKDGTIETERYLTPEQQLGAIQFWQRHDVVYSKCDRADCPCH